MADSPPIRTSDEPQRPALPKDESRVEMMRRIRQLSVKERLELFDRLSRRVAWARSAKRLR